MKKIKALYYLPDTIVGGAETQLLTLLSHLPSHVEAHVATDRKEMGAPFFGLLRKRARVHDSVTTVIALARLIDEQRYDIIHHGHDHAVGAALNVANHIPKIVQVVHGAMHFPGDVTTTSKKFTSHMVAVSQDAAKFFLGACPEWAKKTTVIHNGIDLAVFKPAMGRRKPGPVRILHVGRLCEGDKKLKKIIDACASLESKLWELWIVGTGADVKEIFEYAGKKVPGQVKFWGYRDNVAEIYREADVYVSRSECEGFGLSIAEAAASGLPICMWDCGGIAKLLNDNAALIARSDADFNNDVQIASTLRAGDFGKNARQVAETYFDARKMATAYVTLYEKLLSVPRITAAERVPVVAGISNPNFTGVTQATQAWVGKDNWCSSEGPGYAFTTVLDAVARHKPEILLLGGDNGHYLEGATYLRKQGYKGKILLTWHSSMSFFNFAPKDGALLQSWLRARDQGIIDRIGFVQDGMHQAFGSENKCLHFPNRIPPKTAHVATHGYNKPNIGVFGTSYPWKNQITALWAASRVPASRIHVNTLGTTGPTPSHCDIVEHGNLPHDKFLQILAMMGCTMQLSLSESFGLTACESWRAGVPCVVSPAVQPIDWGLHGADLCVVQSPENIGEVIAAIHCALETGPQVIEKVNTGLDEQDEKNAAVVKKVLRELAYGT